MSMDLMKSGDVETMPRFVPRADVWEEADRVIVHLDLPGVDPKSIDVTVESGTLLIAARSATRQPEGTAWLARECVRGEFRRTFNLGDALNAGSIAADYEDGVLTITLPKVEEAKPRKVDVRVK
jgi:HSP20 family protein